MFLFTRLGRLSLLQHPIDTNLLQVYVQKQVDVDRLVAIFDEIGRERHEIQTIYEGATGSAVAKKMTVAGAVARMVAKIEYSEFMRTCHFDFGVQPRMPVHGDANGRKHRMKPK